MLKRKADKIKKNKEEAQRKKVGNRREQARAKKAAERRGKS
jgi:hypothetical protein